MTPDDAADETNAVTLADLSQRLDVPLTAVLKAAMALGLLKPATEPLAPEDATLVEKLIRLDQA